MFVVVVVVVVVIALLHASGQQIVTGFSDSQSCQSHVQRLNPDH